MVFGLLDLGEYTSAGLPSISKSGCPFCSEFGEYVTSRPRFDNNSADSFCLLRSEPYQNSHLDEVPLVLPLEYPVFISISQL